MDRLTFYDSRNKPCYKIGNSEHTNAVAERLAAYEDTGLTPEDVVRLKSKNSSEKNGCKIYNSSLQFVLGIGSFFVFFIITVLAGLLAYFFGGDKFSIVVACIITAIIMACISGFGVRSFYKQYREDPIQKEFREDFVGNQLTKKYDLSKNTDYKTTNGYIFGPVESGKSLLTAEKERKFYRLMDAFCKGEVIGFIDPRGTLNQEELFEEMQKDGYEVTVVKIKPKEEQSMSQDNVCYSTD